MSLNILSERTATLNYGKIKAIHNNSGHTVIEKTPKLGPVLEGIFKEITNSDVAFETSFIERMKTLFAKETSTPKEIFEDEVTRYSVEIAIITFGRVVTKILDFANIERQMDDFKNNMPLTVKNSNDGTPMGGAVELAIKLLNERKAEYKTAGVEYFQPWLVLMTDGQPTDSISNATTLTSSMVESGKLSLFPIAIGTGANIKELGRFSSKRVPLKLKGLNFREFFEWLKESTKNTSQSIPGQTINLPSVGGWASV
jgi:uncharacterized protein YegL